VHVEPPGPHVHRGQAASSLTTADLRLAAAAGAGALVLTGRGDAFLLAALLALAALDPRQSRVHSVRIPYAMYSGVTVGAVAATLLARWGTSSLPAIGGAQAVLGPAFVVEPVLGAIAVLLAAASLVFVAPPGLVAPVFGAAAGIVVAGPSPTGVVDLLVRVVAVAGGGALAWWLQPRLPDRARDAAPAVAAVAFLCAVVA
jgi:hypothetical protein